MVGEQQDIGSCNVSEGGMGEQTLSWQKEEWVVTKKHKTESTWMVVTLGFRLTVLVSVCVSVVSPGKGELFRTDVLL